MMTLITESIVFQLARVVALAILLAGSTLQANEPAGLDVQLTTEDTQHLLSRTGIGVAPREVLALRGMTRRQAIDHLMTGFEQQPTMMMPEWTRAPVPHYHARPDMSDNERALFNNERDAELAQLRQWWTLNMLQTESIQTERMVLFWHDVFATSYYDIDRQSLAMARQNQTFRELGMGSWEELLKAMIRDAALLQFLDSGSNHKRSPNENLSRELLELFTLGENNYDENTVREAARSLTGHDTTRLHNLQFLLKTGRQDRDNKTLFGNTGAHTGDDLIRIILQQPAAAKFLAKRFWQAFISDQKADSQWVDEIASSFRASDYSIASLYRAMLESDAFWQAKNRGMLIKSPLDLLLGTARALEYPKHQWRTVVSAQTTLGMELFAPPNVAGWKEGAAFVTPGRLLERYKMVDALLQEQDDSVANDSAMMSTLSDENSTVMLRLAAEDYQGPVLYQLALFEGEKQRWQSPARTFSHGHDTQRYGRINEQSGLNWSTEKIEVPESILNDITRLDITYLNDAAGPDGDRNFYVDGVQFKDQWHSGSRAVQVGECPPEQTSNAWKLYCAGTVSFTIQNAKNAEEQSLPAWRASAVHVQWANENAQGNQTVNLVLDDFKTPERNFHTLQFGVVTRAALTPQIRLQSFGCWPSCIESVPDCAWVDRHFPASSTLAFAWLDRRSDAWNSESSCHLSDLPQSTQQLVSALWASLPAILSAAKKTHRAERFSGVLDTLERKLSEREIALSDTPYTATDAMIQIDASFAPEMSAREVMALPLPSINGVDELQAQLDSIDLSIAQLLLPGINSPGMPALVRDGSARERLKAVVQHPLFQVK